jgi:hypothetical protein
MREKERHKVVSWLNGGSVTAHRALVVRPESPRRAVLTFLNVITRVVSPLTVPETVIGIP